MKRFIISILLGAALLVPAQGCGGKKKNSIAVIPKGTTHVFWKSVEAGARKAGADLGVEIIWKGPLKENDRGDQIKIVQQFVSEGVAAIALAPLDYEALVQPVRSAMQAGIPVVIYDSALSGKPGTDFVSYIATNNRKGGQMAGQELLRILGGKGKVVLLRYNVGSASTDERESGFLEVMRSAPGITMLVDNRYGGATVGEAKNEAMRLIDQLKQADGIFCPNESSTVGMLLALRENNLAGKVKFVGFDATPPLVEALRKGEIQALVAQDPVRMGYEAVKACVEKLRGQTVKAEMPMEPRLITLQNLNDPEIRKLVGE